MLNKTQHNLEIFIDYIYDEILKNADAYIWCYFVDSRGVKS